MSINKNLIAGNCKQEKWESGCGVVDVVLRSGWRTLVILNKGQTTIWEEIEIYSQEKVCTIDRLLVDKNIGLVNTE